jgi:hypothetical protein
VGLLVLGGLGCGDDSTVLGTWWWPSLDPDDVDQKGLDGGRGFEVRGYATRVLTSSEPARDLLAVMLVGSDSPASCSSYAAYLSSLAQTQLWFDSVVALAQDDAERPSNAQILGYVCQSIQGAGREAFGSDGAYRALHLIMDLSAGGPAVSGEFRAATKGAAAADLGGAELLSPSTYVGRLYERSVHGEELLPDLALNGNAGDLDPLAACPAIFSSLLDPSEDLPDSAVPVLNAAAHRYYHAFKGEDSLPFSLRDGSTLNVLNGVVSRDFGQLAESGGELSPTVFLDVAGAVDSFPYNQLLLSTQANPVAIEACPELADVLPFVWSELTELGWGVDDGGAGGDDDDSAADPG